ncbi:HIT-like protein [Pholiota conissans]|uniref:HIT-like protein n=1 Tax=Pholiota conissans TaxID=109636 RepID=A0A9P6D7P3_9AGAR|nr:HIT-like protein [Pholiota conissans]
MTSFIIDAHRNRKLHPDWAHEPDCAFCRILRGEIPSNLVYEDEEVIVILDILPLRRGHTLVIPKAHVSRLSELPPDLAGALGKVVSKVAYALTQALENSALNVVCNQEYAQAVPHVHYHIIPAPKFGGPVQVSETTDEAVPGQTSSHRQMHQKEFQLRNELDEDEAKVLLEEIRSRL